MINNKINDIVITAISMIICYSFWYAVASLWYWDYNIQNWSGWMRVLWVLFSYGHTEALKKRIYKL